MLEACVDGQWQTTECMATHGQLCEAGACVDPWRYGAPEFPTCEGEPRATQQSLTDKATGYDEIAARLHVHPELRWAQGVVLKPGVSEAQATWQDVERWLSGENDGLWSALYMASQAYRYAATKDPAALEMLRILMAGERARMDVTGVPLVDTGVANHLNKTIQVARLKGAHTIVTGLSDAVAETIVDLGVDWVGVETLPDLQTGLRVALARMGRRIEDWEQGVRSRE